jgi:hypothetical protein
MQSTTCTSLLHARVQCPLTPFPLFLLLLRIRLMTAESSDRTVIHVELDVADSGMHNLQHHPLCLLGCFSSYMFAG